MKRRTIVKLKRRGGKSRLRCFCAQSLRGDSQTSQTRAPPPAGRRTRGARPRRRQGCDSHAKPPGQRLPNCLEAPRVGPRHFHAEPGRRPDETQMQFAPRAAQFQAKDARGFPDEGNCRAPRNTCRAGCTRPDPQCALSPGVQRPCGQRSRKRSCGVAGGKTGGKRCGMEEKMHAGRQAHTRIVGIFRERVAKKRKKMCAFPRIWGRVKHGPGFFPGETSV